MSFDFNNFKNKKFIFITLGIMCVYLGSLLLAFVGGMEYKSYQNNGISFSKQFIKTEVKEQTVDDAIDKLKSAGFSLGEKKESWYQMIGAYDGAKIDVDEITVEIYQYKESQLNALEDAKESMETADSIIFNKGTLLIVVHSNNTDFSNEIGKALEK